MITNPITNMHSIDQNSFCFVEYIDFGDQTFRNTNIETISKLDYNSLLKALSKIDGINADNSSPLADCNPRSALTFACRAASPSGSKLSQPPTTRSSSYIAE